MSTRPIIRVPLSSADKKVEWIGTMLLVIIWLLTIFALFRLPGIIPTHYNFRGEPDHFGSKFNLLILPATGSIIYFGLGKLNQYPHLFNYMVTITTENATRQYASATRILRYLKLAINFVIISIIIIVYLSSIGKISGAGPWMVPLVIGILFIPTGILIYQALRKN